MGWLICGLLLALAVGLAVFTRWHRRRSVSDDTLLAELLGTPVPRPPAVPPVRGPGATPPVPAPRPAAGGSRQPATQGATRPGATQPGATQPGAEGRPQPATGRPPPPAGEHSAGPAGEHSAGPAGDASWLETQLAWISAWSERMRDEIAASAPGPAAPEPAGPPPARPAAQRCAATTAKGSQCKLPARPGETTCAIHAGRPHPLS